VLRAGEEGVARREITLTFFAPLSEGGRAMVKVSGREALMGVDPAAARSIFASLDDLRPAAEIEKAPEAQ
jgi:hypothetical protein